MMENRPVSDFTADQLIDRLVAARHQLKALVRSLPDGGWLGPRAEHLNPPLWEYGHIAWFQERWCLRHEPGGHCSPSMVARADSLYDSSAVPHDTRWDLPLLPPAEAERYAGNVLEVVAERLRHRFNPDLAYFAELSLYHELMHIEAWWMAFQNLAYVPPRNAAAPTPSADRSPPLAFKAGVVHLGSGPDEGFIFDNEKWRHLVTVPAFEIDRVAVTEGVFADFVDAGGYRNKAVWTDAGWAWRDAEKAVQPLYWKREEGRWRVRRFAEWTPLIPDAPMLHVNQHEATACASWMGRQLPTSAQWLLASAHPDFSRDAGWEWLRHPFIPYPGFSADPYRNYSQPWFHSHWELRGGGPFTDPSLMRPGFRNFYLPHRRDPFAGFRTVSPD